MKNIKLDFIKIKHFCFVKGTIERVKMQAPYWERNLQNTYLIKDFYLKYRKNS